MKNKAVTFIIILSLLPFAACNHTSEDENEISPIIIEEDDNIETETPDDSEVVEEETPAPEEVSTIYVIKRKYDEDGNLLWEEEQDDLGRTVKRTMYDDDYSIDLYFSQYPCVVEWEYDEAGNVIHQFVTNSHDVVTDETTSEYDSNDVLRRKVHIMKYEYGKIESEEEIIYNEAGNEIQRNYAIYDSKGDKEQRTETEYDEEKRIYTSKHYYNHNAEARVTKNVNEYDEFGRLINYTEYSYDGSISYEIHQEYYDNGIMKKQTMKQNGAVYENEYDEKGSTTRYSIYQDGVLQYLDEYVNEYDGDILSQTRTHYDADGKWQECEKVVVDLTKPYETNQLEWEGYDIDGNVTGRHIMVYDEQDRYLGYERYEEDGTVTQRFWNSYEYVYDEQGRLLSEKGEDYRIEYEYPLR